MSIEYKSRQTMPWRYEGLVPLESAVDVMIGSSQVVVIDEGTDPSHRVRAWAIARNPLGPELALSRLLQGIEAAETRQEHHERSFDHSAGRNSRALPTVRDFIEDVRKAEDLPGVAQDPTENGFYLSLLRSFSC